MTRRLAAAAFALVILQAVLGGVTVLLELPLAIAVTGVLALVLVLLIKIFFKLGSAWTGMVLL